MINHPLVIFSSSLIKRLACFVVGSSLPLLSWAQLSTPLASSLPVPSGVPTTSDYLTQVLLGLGFVLALVFAMGWLIKRVGQGNLVGGQMMRVLASLPLSTRERLLLVDVGGQQLLLGVAPGRITTLHTFEEPILQPNAPINPSEFGKKLREIMGASLSMGEGKKTEFSL